MFESKILLFIVCLLIFVDLNDCFVYNESVLGQIEDGDVGLGYHVLQGIPRARFLIELEAMAPRIVGGTQVENTDVYPYHAGIVVTLTSGWTSVCGGSLVSSTRVLTAAHCWFDGRSQAGQFTIVLGSLYLFNGGTRIITKDVVVHPSWNINEITHDVAMVKIKEVSFNNNIQKIPLPTLADLSLNLAGMTATVSGFGKTSDAQNSIPTTTALYHSSLTIISNGECQKSFEVPIHDSHLCTSGKGNKGTCDGDSGGPLTVIRNKQRVLVGIVSFGLADGCEKGYPSVFTRVTAFLTWVSANL